MVVVECTPILKKVRAAEIFENGSIVCTVNSFTSDEMKPYDDAKGNDYDSHRRYRTVLDSLVIYRAEGDPRKKKFVTDNRLHDLIRRG